MSVGIGYQKTGKDIKRGEKVLRNQGGQQEMTRDRKGWGEYKGGREENQQHSFV